MKKLLIALAAAGLALPVLARDTVYKLPFAEVLALPEAQQKLDGSVKFYLKGQATPTVTEKLGDDVSNKKANGVGYEDADGCKRAALSALISFQESAKQKGANAVVDLVSYYKRNTFESATEYECHAGGIVIGVTLKGSYAKLAN